MPELLQSDPVGLNKELCKIYYMLGKMEADTNHAREMMHTCKQQHLRYPCPPDPDCSGCRYRIEEQVKIFYLETAYPLFGWDMIVDHIDRHFAHRSNLAYGVRNQGAHI